MSDMVKVKVIHPRMGVGIREVKAETAESWISRGIATDKLDDVVFSSEGFTQADVDAAFAKGKAEAMEEFVVNPEVQREFIVNAVEKKTGKKPRSDSKLSTMAAELEKTEE